MVAAVPEASDENCEPDHSSSEHEIDDEDVGDDEDDDEGWITPENVAEIKKADIARNQTEIQDLTVACLTTDYAMQASWFRSSLPPPPFHARESAKYV